MTDELIQLGGKKKQTFMDCVKEILPEVQAH